MINKQHKKNYQFMIRMRLPNLLLRRFSSLAFIWLRDKFSKLQSTIDVLSVFRLLPRYLRPILGKNTELSLVSLVCLDYRLCSVLWRYRRELSLFRRYPSVSFSLWFSCASDYSVPFLSLILGSSSPSCYE